jgi:hypothetical protein
MVEESPIGAALMTEDGRIDTSALSEGAQYDYTRLEHLMADNTHAIQKMAKKLSQLDPNIIIPRKDIHAATNGYQNKLNRRKSILK